MSHRLPKLLLGILLFLVLALLLAPGLIGRGVRDNTIERALTLFPAEARQQLSISERSYSGGWFASSGVLDVLYNPLGLNERIALTVRYTIDHGPVVRTDAGLRPGLAYARLTPEVDDVEFNSALAELPFPPPQIDLSLLAGFDRSLRLGLTVTPVDYAGADGEFLFGGIDAAMVAHGDQSADFSFTMGRLQARAAGGIGFSVDGIRLQSQSAQLDDLLAPASADVAITGIASDGPVPVRIDSITAASRLTPNPSGPDRLDIQQQFDVNGMESALPVAALSLTTAVNGLEGEIIRNYYTLLSEFQQQVSGGGTVSGLSLNDLGQDLALELVGNPLQLNNAATGTVYEGAHSVRLDIDWAGLPGLTSLRNLAIARIVAALGLELDVDLDLEAVLRSPLAAYVDPYVQQGVIVLDNNRIRLQARLRDSELLLNGEAIALDQYIVL
ncbi:MAG: DUF945 family protein [Pseudohongiellaceae bacterium]